MKKLLNRSWVKFALEIAEIYFSRRVARSAAELAYFLILSFFPILICVNAFIALFDVDISPMVQALEPVLPGGTMAIFADYMAYITDNQSGALLGAGVVMTLFASSAAFRALMNIMDDIYERKSYKGAWQIVASVAFSVLFLVTIYLSMAVLLTGDWLFQLLEERLMLDTLAIPWDWQWIRFIILFCLVLIFVLLVYRLSAPRGRPQPPILAGGFIAAVSLVVASVIFSLFIGMSSRYSMVYGSLTSVIILLVWLYLCGNILILGNIFNCVWYRRRRAKFIRQMRELEDEWEG